MDLLSVHYPKEQQNVTSPTSLRANSHILGLVSFMVPNSVSLIKLDEHSFLFHVKIAQVSETRGNKQLPILQEPGSLPHLCLPCLTEIWLVLKIWLDAPGTGQRKWRRVTPLF